MQSMEMLAIAEDVVRRDSAIRQFTIAVPVGQSTCLKCGSQMVSEVRENIEFRNCACGYGSRTSAGVGTAAWRDVKCLR